MNFIKKIYNYFVEDNYKIILLFSFMAIFPLLIVYILEYFFGVQPCKLCIYQRIPLFIIGALPLTLYFSSLRKYCLYGFFLISFLILINVALSFYHLGIENKWFTNSLCRGFIGENSNSLEKLFLSSETLLHRCDEVKFRFLKISLAGWNFIYCLGFFVMVNFIIARNFLIKIEDN